MRRKTYKLLGLAAKAGKILSGNFACEKALKEGKTQLIIVAEDALPNTKKKFSNACKYREVDIRFFGEKEVIGNCIGKQSRAVVGITDAGFAKALIEMIKDSRALSGGEQDG